MKLKQCVYNDALWYLCKWSMASQLFNFGADDIEIRAMAWTAVFNQQKYENNF